MSLEHIVLLERRAYSKNDGDLTEGHRSQLGGLPLAKSGQSEQQNSDSNGL